MLFPSRRFPRDSHAGWTVPERRIVSPVTKRSAPSAPQIRSFNDAARAWVRSEIKVEAHTKKHCEWTGPKLECIYAVLFRRTDAVQDLTDVANGQWSCKGIGCQEELGFVGLRHVQSSLLRARSHWKFVMIVSLLSSSWCLL